MHQKTRTRISRTACPCGAPLRSRSAARSPWPRAEPAPLLASRSRKALPVEPLQNSAAAAASFRAPRDEETDASFCCESRSPLPLLAVRPCVCEKSPPALPLRSSPPFAKPPPQQQRQPRTLAPVCLLREDPKPLNFLHFQLHLHGNHRLSSNPPHPP